MTSDARREPMAGATALDAAGLDVFVREHHARLVALARLVCFDPSEASDAVQAALEGKDIPIVEAGLDRFPKSAKELSESEAEKFLKFYEALEEQDDIQRLFANFEIPDEVMEKLGS